MLLPEIKEREYRFKLALRIGLPIFALIFALILSTFATTYESLHTTFYITSILLLTVSIYFIFFLIYRGFDARITEYVSKTFTREYLYTYLKKDIKTKKEYTLILLSIDNLHDINSRYGIPNGDKVLYEVVQYISQYFKDKKIGNFPMGHIKGGDFIIGLKGLKEEFASSLELLCLKSSEFKVDEIEVNISGAITDTSFSDNLEHMIENLFELQEANRTKKVLKKRDEINPNKLESYVIKAINEQAVTIMTQDIYEDSKPVMKECFARLKSSDEKILHPKSYMKIVNKLGLSAEYDFLILQKSILTCSESDTLLSITLDPTSLRNHDFLTKAKELIRNNIHVKNRLVFLLSETEYYSHTDRYNATLQSLRKEGVKIAIDRLGSFHTSFLYLRDLDIDMVRFDTFYTKDIENIKYKSILQGFNTMAQSKGVKTWLKMVENIKIKELAKSINIDYTQGKELAQLKEESK